MIVDLTPKECALVYRAVKASDWSYAGGVFTAQQIQRKVLPGAIEYTQLEHDKAEAARKAGE